MKKLMKLSKVIDILIKQTASFKNMHIVGCIQYGDKVYETVVTYTYKGKSGSVILDMDPNNSFFQYEEAVELIYETVYSDITKRKELLSKK